MPLDPKSIRFVQFHLEGHPTPFAENPGLVYTITAASAVDLGFCGIYLEYIVTWYTYPHGSVSLIECSQFFEKAPPAESG